MRKFFTVLHAITLPIILSATIAGNCQIVNFPNGSKNSLQPNPSGDLNLYSGTKTVTIPLWECTSKGFSFPIELVYSASGIKVDQPASWVGLGWELEAGGSIARAVKGYPDDINLPNDEQIGWLFIDNILGSNKRVAAEVDEFDNPVQTEFERTMALDNFCGNVHTPPKLTTSRRFKLTTLRRCA